jgi:hypothetical protein
MDHEEVLEQLELAAVEPGGLDRLMAGDTAEAAAIAGHLAGCPACATDLERLRRSVPMLRDVIRTTPSPELRDRTLAFVREHGVARVPQAAATVSAAPVRPAAASATQPVATARSSMISRTLPWVAAIAAAVLISVVATTAIVTTAVDMRLTAQEDSIRALEYVTVSTIAITGEPDVERVALEPTAGTASEGTLMFSPSTTELVVVAGGLTEPPSAQEYRCWVEVEGERVNVGKMFFADELAYWVGDVPAVASLPAGSTFGVSIADVDGASLDADPVLVGRL